MLVQLDLRWGQGAGRYLTHSSMALWLWQYHIRGGRMGDLTSGWHLELSECVGRRWTGRLTKSPAYES